MKLNEKQLRHIIDKHVESILNEEWFGQSIWNTAKKVGQSNFLQNVGNMISPGYGNQINSFAKGDWKSANNGNYNFSDEDKQRIMQGSSFKEWCRKNNITNPSDKNLTDYYNEVMNIKKQ